jgi:hypothetical protein
MQHVCSAQIVIGPSFVIALEGLLSPASSEAAGSASDDSTGTQARSMRGNP